MAKRAPERTRRQQRSGPEEPTVFIGMSRFRQARRSALWLRWRRWVALVLTLVLVVLAGWLLMFSPYLTSQKVEVSGVTTVSPLKVRRVAQVPLDRPLLRIDLDTIRARVENIAAVRQASVSRSWPHTVRIEISERVPVAVVDRGSGLQSLDSEGVLFGRWKNRPDDLPLVRTDPRVGTDALAEAGRVAAALPPALAGRVDHLQVASVDKITLHLKGGVTILWGNADQSEAKAEVVEVLLKRKVSQIDVSVPGRPTTR